MASGLLYCILILKVCERKGQSQCRKRMSERKYKDRFWGGGTGNHRHTRDACQEGGMTEKRGRREFT
jgi:hypothetical protein